MKVSVWRSSHVNENDQFCKKGSDDPLKCNL